MTNTRTIITTFTLALLLACSVDPDAASAEFVQAGQALATAGEWESAAVQFRSAVELKPDNIEARKALADAFGQLGQHSRAVDELRAILEQEPEHIEASLLLGRYYLTPDWYGEAQRLADSVLAKQPDNVEARIILANAFHGQGNVADGIAQLNRILQSNPSELETLLTLSLMYQGTGDSQTAEKTLKTTLDYHPESGAVHRALGDFYAVEGNAPSAEIHLKEAFNREPAKHWKALVGFYSSRRELDKAERFLREYSAAYPDARDALFGLVELLLRHARVEEAIDLLKSRSLAAPTDTLISLRLAEVYLDLGRWEEARPLADAALEVDANGPEAHLVNARILRAQGKVTESLAELDEAIALKRPFPPAHLLRATILLGERSLDEAEKSAREALTGNSRLGAAHSLLAKILSEARRAEDAIVEADKALGFDPSDARALEAKGDGLLLQSRLDDARIVFEQLSTLNPQSPFYIFRLGTIDAQQGNRPAARQRFMQALQIDSDYQLARQGLLRLHTEAGDIEGALAEVDRMALPDDEKHRFRAEVRILERDFEAAESELRQALEIAPGNMAAHMRLAGLRLTQGDVEAAIAEADALIAKEPELVSGYVMKGYYLERAGDAEAAMGLYVKALEMDPDQPNAMAANNLAFLYAERGERLSEALRLARIVRRQDPTNAEYADTLGWVHFKMRAYDLAIDQFLFGINNGRPGAENYFRLGMAYHLKGDKNLARQTLRKALELDDSFPEAGTARRVLADSETEPQG